MGRETRIEHCDGTVEQITYDLSEMKKKSEDSRNDDMFI